MLCIIDTCYIVLFVCCVSQHRVLAAAEGRRSRREVSRGGPAGLGYARLEGPGRSAGRRISTLKESKAFDYVLDTPQGLPS